VTEDKYKEPHRGLFVAPNTTIENVVDHVVLDAGNDEVLKAASDWLSGLTTH
jgi:hypothetical protein